MVPNSVAEVELVPQVIAKVTLVPGVAVDGDTSMTGSYGEGRSRGDRQGGGPGEGQCDRG